MEDSENEGTEKGFDGINGINGIFDMRNMKNVKKAGRVFNRINKINRIGEADARLSFSLAFQFFVIPHESDPPQFFDFATLRSE